MIILIDICDHVEGGGQGEEAGGLHDLSLHPELAAKTMINPYTRSNQMLIRLSVYLAFSGSFSRYLKVIA